MKWAWLVVVYLYVVTVTSQEIPQDNNILWVEVDDAATERQQEIATEQQCACQGFYENMTQAVVDNVQIVNESIQQAVQQITKLIPDTVTQLEQKVSTQDAKLTIVQHHVENINKSTVNLAKWLQEKSVDVVASTFSLLVKLQDVEEQNTRLQQQMSSQAAQLAKLQADLSVGSTSVVASTDTMLVKLQDVEKQNTRLQQQMSSQAAQLAKLQADLSVGIGAIPRSMRCKVNDKLQKINGRNYYFSDNKVPWSDARQFCDKNGMQLVSIETVEEWQAIESYLNNTYGTTRDRAHWTSGSDASVEGKWVWASTGEPMKFHKYSGMFNTDQYNCMGICSLKTKSACKWTDDECSHSLRFICEMSSLLC